jgi:outer membrane protein assembly factor BamA/autotransporter translocation and assembly factor TamB
MWKHVKRIGLLLIFVGVGVTAVVWIALQTSTFQQWLLRRTPVQAQRLSLDIWNLRATLDGLNYDDDSGTSITASRVSIDIPWDGLRGDVIRITNLVAEGVTIDARPSGPAASTPPEIPRIAIESLSIRNAALTYSDGTTTLQIPTFHIEAQNGRGTLRLDAPATLAPDLRLVLPELALQLSDRSVDFGPSQWRIEHTDVTVAGSTNGRLEWSPALMFNADYSTNPFAYGNWKDLESSGKVAYQDGVVTVTDLRMRAGEGSASGSLEIRDRTTSAKIQWTALDLTPAGFPALADGNLELRWQDADFSDLSGAGAIAVNSLEYGRMRSDVTIRNARADLDVRATAFDAQVQARVTAGLDRSISGTFQATHSKYGRVRLAGTLGGKVDDPIVIGKLAASDVTYNGVGPLEASANATLRSRVVLIDGIQFRLRNSTAPRGSLRVDLNTQRITGDIPEIHVTPADFVSSVEGNAAFSAVIEGSIEKPVVRITGSSDDLRLAGTAIENVRLTGEATTETVRLTELTARRKDGALQASGSYTFATEAIAATAAITNLPVDQIQDLNATASLTATLSGTPAAPAAVFSGRVAGIRFRDQDHGDLDLDGTLRNRLASIDVRSGKYSATATAEVAINEPFAYSASAKADQSQVVYNEFDFLANGGVRASGTLKPFTVERVVFDDLAVRGEGVDLTASGVFPDGARINGVADLGMLTRLVQIDHPGLAALGHPTSREGDYAIQATGEARLQAVVSGTLDDPRIEGSVETSNATVFTPGMTAPATVQAAVDFTRNEFSIRQLQAGYAGAAASFSGRGTTAGTGDFEFRFDNVRPERMIEKGPVTGLINIEGKLAVSAPNLDGVRASAKVTQLEVTAAGVPIRQVEPIEVLLEKQLVTARNIVLEGLNTRAAITGNANLATRELNLSVSGNTDVQVLQAFLPGSKPGGRIRTSIDVRGTPERPNLDGFLNLDGIQLEIADPPVSIADVDAQIQLRGDRIQILSASGSINGGSFTAAGGAGISSAGLGETAVQLTLTGAQTEYPEGFQSELSSLLSLNGKGTDLAVTGNVDILSAVYRRDISLAEEVMARVAGRSAQASVATAAQPSFVDEIDLDIAVRTAGSASVSNNLANFDMEGSFRLRGTVANPVITGRAEVLEGGEIYFGPQVGATSATDNARRDRYVIAEGTIDFVNPIRTEPSFNFIATREVRTTKDEPYIITLHASGTPDNLETELTSDPPLDEPNIVALLLTGRTLEDLEGAELAVAQEQAANYVAGRFGNLFQNAGSTFGLDTVRLDPVLLAGDEDLSARLTLGRYVTRNFNLVYSQNLSGPRAQTWIASYRALQDLLIRGINYSDDNKLTVELRHDLKWGGGPDLPRAPKPVDETVLGEVTFEGGGLPMEELLKRVTRPGRPFSAYQLNTDLRSLRQYYAERDFLGVNIRAVRNPRDGAVDVRFVINEGPSIRFEFEGASVPRAVQEDIRQIWIRGFAETLSLRQSRDRLVRHFRDEGYLQADVDATDASPSPETRRFVFRIARGSRFGSPQWVFRGIESMDLNVTPGVVLEDPKAIQSRILNALWSDGYLNASSSEPQLIIDGRDARFEVSVERGPRYTIGRVTATDPDVLTVLPPGLNGRKPAEGLFTAAWLDRARQSIVQRYWENGFNDVEVVADVDTAENNAVVHVDFKIEPGPQQIVNRIDIEGAGKTNRDYILRQFTFKEGEPVNILKLNLTRKNLYDTRLFRRVDLSVVEGDNGYIARTRLNERPPWNFRYGFAVTDELQTNDREFGATADFSYSNLLGKGITAGTSVKYTADWREARIFSSTPLFFGRNVTTTGAFYRQRDLSIPSSITDWWGFTVQQQWRLGQRYVASYDYSYKYGHTYSTDFDPDDFFSIIDISIPSARFNGTLSRDTRNDILNATTGSFMSNSFEIAPPGIGSSVLFLKNFTQYFRFEPLRESVVWATGIRLGLARGFQGQELSLEEKFRAGGGTTVRAFQQDKLAPFGQALFILNQELRFPLIWRFSGVGFFDAGNVYAKSRDLNPFRLRYSPGAGLRIETPLVLVRFDLGWNVSPKPGEPRYRFAFGVGQAF